jgi:ribosomal protein S18 acetylase RimI-like enzyme
MKIRKANKKDLEEIKNLNTRIFINNIKYDKDAVEEFAQTDQGAKYFKDALEDKEGIFLIAEEDGQIIGYINGTKADFSYRKSKYFEMYNLGVSPSHKRKGIGTKLLDEFTKEVKKRGFQKIYLNCYAKNLEAINFYKASGYQTIDVCMEKEI